MLQTRLVVLPLPNLGFTMTVIAATIQRMTPALLFRYRVSLALFLAGLVFSGLTAFPLLVEIRILSGWLGITDPANYQELTGLAHWIAYVNFGLEQMVGPQQMQTKLN